MHAALSADSFLTDPGTDKIVPRLVISEDGRIVHASEGFEQLVRASSYALVGSKLQDLIVFANPDRALRDQPFSARNSDPALHTWCTSIEEGIHEIMLRDRGDQVFSFQFDWLQRGDGPRYLVAWENETGAQTPLVFKHGQVVPLQKIEKQSILPSQRIYLKGAFMPSARSARSQNRDSIFTDLADDVMMTLFVDGRIETANRAFFDSLGHPPQSLQFLNFIDLIEESDRAHVRSILMGMAHNEAGTAPVNLEACAMGFDQKAHVMNWRLRRVDGRIFALGRDLTATRAHEASLLRHQQQLSEAEAIAHMGYWRWKAGGDTVVWSDEIYRIFGVEHATFTPTIDNINAMLVRQDVGRMIQAFQRAMIEQNTYDMDFRITRPDGQIRYIRCEGRCETDETGDVIALFGIMQDMTESAETERKLREAKESAERAYETKSKFLANMSHELRTPLNAIIGFSEMMQRQLLGPIGTEKYLDYIDGIRQSGEHLLDLISDILDMSKIEAGKYTLDIENLNIAKLAHLALSMVEGRAKDACVDLTCNDFGENLQIRADRRAILQIMLNLLSNAIKFTEPGGAVRLDLMPSNDQIKLVVSDTGIGIPADKLHIITNPFEQAANHYTRSHEGSGLGLSITKELVLMHGGHLTISSEVGKGTIVTMTLPAESADKKPT